MVFKFSVAVRSQRPYILLATGSPFKKVEGDYFFLGGGGGYNGIICPCVYLPVLVQTVFPDDIFQNR